MTRRRALALLLTAWALAVPGFAQDDDLWVSTAVSLKQPLLALIEDFLDGPSGRGCPPIHVNAGGSSVLTQQALRGAPADLLLSASRDEIARLVSSGQVDQNDICALAANTLVVVVPAGGRPIHELGRLLDPRFERVGVANPRTAPLGRYTRQALDSAGLRGDLANRLILAEHARQVVDYVARGEVDAAVVYATDARRFADRVAVALEIDPGLHEPIEYVAARIRGGSRDGWDRRLFDHLCSEDGRARFVESGFESWPGRR